MPLRPLQLHRRRWTLVFSVPFIALMALVGAYSIFLLFTGDRLVMVIGGIGAFVALCIVGTLGRSVVEAWRNNDPAVVVDQHGLNDLRSATGLIPWREIETVTLDVYEQRIIVKVAANSRRSITRRLLVGGDYAVALGGLSYSHRELSNALDEYHRLGRGANAGMARPSDA